MKQIILTLIFFTLCSFAAITGWASSDKDEPAPASAPAIFSNQPRPTPEFDHTLHEESLGETGCAKCHHVLDEESGKLVYAEDEEAGCMECHSAEPSDDTTTLREANHASCTGCHREMKKDKETTGPTTCGECHRN